GRTTLAHCPTARLDAELLLEHVSDFDRAYFRAHGERELPETTVRAYKSVLARRARGEPIAYITGRKGFWSLTLEVGPEVLIPRPETELLVERALAHLPTAARCDVLDVGTGSGAIALALAKERPSTRVVATDVSAAALARAQANARSLQLQVELLAGDLFAPVREQRFHVVVSNPPYVAADDPDLAAEVRQYEPEMALFAADGGLATLKRLIAEAPEHLHDRGWLLLEHGWRQAEPVRALLEQRGFSHVRSHADLAGHERVTEGQLTGHG
ncbi:MAG: peptide chain release factor N(5)-glutamine methyltransferase, partial [Steroidobacteraceae bacterium]